MVRRSTVREPKQSLPEQLKSLSSRMETQRLLELILNELEGFATVS
jgi:hypothetical protein